MLQLSALILVIFSIIILTNPPQAHAIIFLPALILIPIAKIVALVIGGFSLPGLGLGVLWHKLFHKSLKRTLLVLVIALIILGLLIALFLKIENPARPLF